MPLDYLCLLRFDEALRNLSAQEFASLLARELGARSVVVGHDFRFGKNGEATAPVLADAGRQLGFEVEVLPAVTLGNERISSSGVRAALAAADFGRARGVARAALVDARAREGRPAARAQPRVSYGQPRARAAPRAGGGRVRRTRARHRRAAARPGSQVSARGRAVAGTEALLEAHVFDFDADLYGREIAVEFVEKLREEAYFASLEALAAQMQRDAAAARRILEV